MEFPNLGEHCSEESCKQLDFLPMKCDACRRIFCKDHFLYSHHNCQESYKKDVQVPICPLCNKPIPVKVGELPDIKVGEHIDRDCKSDPQERSKLIYTNKCYYQKCKQKEMVRITCSLCHYNFCLKHRHPEDHQCQATDTTKKGTAISKSGIAALSRLNGNAKITTSPVHRQRGTQPSAHSPESKVVAFQGSVDEDEAFARALQMSLMESENNDELLARSLSQQEYLENQRRNNRQNSSCVVA